MNFKNLSKAFASFLKKTSKTGRRNRRTVNRNPIRFNIGRRTSALGSQFRVQMVTQFLTGALDELVRIPLYDLMSSVEFSSVALNWRYFKLQGITVTVYPNNNNTTSSPAYLLMNWGDGSGNNLRLDNNVKIIPAYRTRFYSYTWLAPNIESDGFTLNKYHPIDEAPLFPGAISIHAPSNIDVWTIRLDAKVKFKGSRTDSNTKNEEMKMSNYIVKIEELELEKEEFKNKIKKIYKIGEVNEYNYENLIDEKKDPCKYCKVNLLTQHDISEPVSNLVQDTMAKQTNSELEGLLTYPELGTVGETGTENPGSCSLTKVSYLTINPSSK